MARFSLNSIPDLDSRSASNLISLVNTIKKDKCSIALGAGMSASVGLPTWDKFLRRIVYAYFEHWIFGIVNNRKKCDFLNPPKNLSIAFTEGYDFILLQKEIDELEGKLNEIECKKDSLIQDLSSSMVQDISARIDKLNLDQFKRVFEKYIKEIETENNVNIDVLDFDEMKSFIVDSLKIKSDIEDTDECSELFENGKQLSDQKVAKLNEKFKEEEELEDLLRADFLSALESKGNLLMAQMIKNRIKEKDWNYLLRKALYHSYEYDPYSFRISLLMKVCIDLI